MEAALPDDPVGNHTLPPSYRVENGDTSDVSQHNPPLEDISAALSARLSADGRKSWTGNQNANGNKITGLAPGTSANDAMTVGQLGTVIGNAPEKATPVDNDRLAISDSANSLKLKYVKWGSFKTSLNPLFNDKFDKSGGTITGRTTVNMGTDGGIGTATAGQGSLGIAVTAGAAKIALYNGTYAVYFGLDWDNKLKVGGWSMGANAYELYHSGNPQPPTVYTGSSVDEVNFPVGHYVAVIVSQSAEPVRNASITVRLDSFGPQYTSLGSGTALSGTWRSRGKSGWSFNDRTNYLMQRVA